MCGTSQERASKERGLGGPSVRLLTAGARNRALVRRWKLQQLAVHQQGVARLVRVHSGLDEMFEYTAMGKVRIKTGIATGYSRLYG